MDARYEAGSLNAVLPPTMPSGATLAPRYEQDDARIRDCDWQTLARAAYVRSAREAVAHLRSELARRLHHLTGRTVPEQAVVIVTDARSALAVLDGVVFQLRGDDLAVVRPCAYCATGRFESAPIRSRSDLGRALAAWQPLHPDCLPEDPPDDVSW